MDIPNTGAVFTLGKSHLAENTQSYFYIKNDPVKRLISGPHQSAVICESGRLFVWGENHHGQLGIGGGGASNNNNGNNGNNGDVVTKPTCVKSLKTLGLKIADVAFGNDWSIILTQSNELFFSGRNVFPPDAGVSRNFIAAEVDGEPIELIRKPFRLEEFDDCLSDSEEPENFVTVLAGNEHFAVMTSFGRLIGWGSNASHQLGLSSHAGVTEEPEPLEIILDAPVQQFTCGPESTLVLTESGNLYLTGRLNEFVFAQFTELQKNLSPTEQIIFIHISKASEIYIVTNAGSIYRSIESVRNKSLIFQRFYDYDSEENGPIWKLLRGFSFYTVLTKANKFYTTFSESGHHLKTFREISKFKNLRLLDMAVGDQHILVHGIPRSSTLSATVGSGDRRFMGRSFASPGDLNGSAGRGGPSALKERIPEEDNEEEAGAEGTQGAAPGDGDENHNPVEEREETPKPNTPVHANGEDGHEEEPDGEEANDENQPRPDLEAVPEEENGNEAPPDEAAPNGEASEEDVKEPEGVEGDPDGEKRAGGKEATGGGDDVDDDKENGEKDQDQEESVQKSPSESVKSRRSARSIKFDEQALKKSPASEKQLRPRTPYPESSRGSTPQTARKTTAVRNFSYEAAMQHDALENTTPALHDSLDDISEKGAGEDRVFKASIETPTPPSEEDEQLTVEIQTTTDPLDQTVVNEIRFINNGIDVTTTAAKALDRKIASVESTLDEEDDEEEEEGRGDLKEASGLLDRVGEKLEEKVEAVVELKNEAKEEVKETTEKLGENVESKLTQAKESMESAAQKVATGARGAVDALGENAKKVATGAREAVDTVGEGAKKMATGARDAVDTVGANAKKAASDAGHAMGALGSKAMDAASDAGHAMGHALSKVAGDTKHAVESMTSKISTEMHEAKDNLASMLHGKSPNKSEPNGADEGDSSEATSKGGLKTITGEDDERTTASVNSNHTSSGNPFESGNPFDNGNPFENDDMGEDSTAVPPYERGRQALSEGLHLETEKKAEKGKVRQFLRDMKSKGKAMSCRNEKSIRIEDEPPRYTPVDSLAHRSSGQLNNSTHSNNGHSEVIVNGDGNNTSKVCTIL